MNGPCVSGSKPIFGSSTDDGRLHWGVWEVPFAPECDQGRENGALQRVEPAKASRRDNGVWRRVGHGGFRTWMSWQKGANGLVAALRGGGPRCRTRVLKGGRIDPVKRIGLSQVAQRGQGATPGGCWRACLPGPRIRCGSRRYCRRQRGKFLEAVTEARTGRCRRQTE